MLPEKERALVAAAAKAEFEESASLQREFKTLEAYVAFRQGEAAGRVHIYGGVGSVGPASTAKR